MNFYKINLFVFSLLVALILVGCNKKKEYLYEVVPVTVKNSTGNKSTLKTATEFISIAYSDVLGLGIKTNDLNKYTDAYDNFGDSKYMEHVIVLNFLNNHSSLIKSDNNMRANPKEFVTQVYKTLYARLPSAYEQEYLSSFIIKNPALTSKLFYYSLLTSNEYRYY